MNVKTANLINKYNDLCPSGVSSRVMRRAWDIMSQADKDKSRRAMQRFLSDRKARIAKALEIGVEMKSKAND